MVSLELLEDRLNVSLVATPAECYPYRGYELNTNMKSQDRCINYLLKPIADAGRYGAPFLRDVGRLL
ncbi:MAG: hypothetical protein ACI9BW_001025 [Gammaproteobacteria bacterium]|jgi:hypothetical protein